MYLHWSIQPPSPGTAEGALAPGGTDSHSGSPPIKLSMQHGDAHHLSSFTAPTP